MNYTEYKIFTPDEQSSEIAVAELSDMGFDSFTGYDPDQGLICGYITEELNRSGRRDIEACLRRAGLTFEERMIPAEDWNSLWESNFEPIAVGGRCYIRAPFHEPKNFLYEMVIMPKMSFGTGHHATTHLMVEGILREDFEGLSGADIGSGTGILAILAAMLGASRVDAIDIDRWAYENCTENIAANDVQRAVRPILGDALALRGHAYDFTLANINRNILIRDLPLYAESMRGGAFLLLSGILEADVPDISQSVRQAGLTVGESYLRDGWAMIKAVK